MPSIPADDDIQHTPHRTMEQHLHLAVLKAACVLSISSQNNFHPLKFYLEN